MKEYSTLENTVVRRETVIEKSRFIAYVKGVADVEEATAFIAEIKKKHFDATHNCYAYLVDDKGKFSDDGEPQGTAGLPIFEGIRQNGLNRVCAVVTRYFGGVKLGAGGLTRAYGGAVNATIRQAQRLEIKECVQLSVTVDYPLLKTVERALSGKATLLQTEFGEKVSLLFLFPAHSYDTILHIVTEITNGKAAVSEKERLLCPYREQI